MPRQFTTPTNNIPPLVKVFIAFTKVEDKLKEITDKLNVAPDRRFQQEKANLDQQQSSFMLSYLALLSHAHNIDLLSQIKLFVTLDDTLILDGVPDPSIHRY